ncbi:glycosyltransferase [Herbiconiux liukaitaii]|uniref:glycosyltransferase n=1 Tax=Herbiconiux liukaitaii TaxID=3342799 RepID=UPI0035B94D53
MSTTQFTFLFMPESAYGPTNNCIGIGNELLRRGHRVVFAAEASWAGKLSALGFEEDLVELAPAAEPDDGSEVEEPDAGAFWKDYIREISPEFAKSTEAQLDTVIRPIWEELVEGAKFCEPALKAIIERTRPDVIIEDNVLLFPALATAGVPFVRIVSCNPLEVPGPGVAPAFSGLAALDHDGHERFRAEYDRTHRALWQAFDEFVQQNGAAPLPELEFLPEGDLNLYVYPQELDYTEERPLGETWHRLDSSVRETDAPAGIPEAFLESDRPLVYFSLGSLGSADVSLMRRVISVLATLPYDVIVSKGPLHDEIELADNMWGAEFLPQTSIIPEVDLVITHGGNNTVTEALHFGKPMILLPLFWDQYDNAQRVHEKGLGRRLPTYSFTDEELATALDELLSDTALRTQIARIGEDIRARDGLRKAADLIEAAALKERA